MRNSELSFSKPFLSKRAIGICFALLSFLGFLDATYLVIEHNRGVVPCALIEGCERVLTSPYAEVGGVPVALFGSAYYFAIFLLSVLYLNREEEKFLAIASCLPFAGFAASLWFVFVQLVILRAVCLYCMLSALDSTLLFAGGLYYIVTSRNGKIKKDIQ